MDMFKKARNKAKAAVKDAQTAVQQQVQQISAGSQSQSQSQHTNTYAYQSPQHQSHQPSQAPQQPQYGQQVYHSSPTAPQQYPQQSQYPPPAPVYQGQPAYSSNNQQYFPPPQTYQQAPQQSSVQTPGSTYHTPVAAQPVYQQPTSQQSLPTGYPSSSYQNVPAQVYIPPQAPLLQSVPSMTRPVQAFAPESIIIPQSASHTDAQQPSMDSHHSHLPAYPPKLSSPWRTKCCEFEEVLTDVVPFYELTTSILQSYSMPIPPESLVVICEYCFLALVAPYPNLANCFKLRPTGELPEDKASPQICFERVGGCAMAFPRIRSTMTNQCIPQNSIQPFVNYCRLDSQLGACANEPQTGPYYGTKAIDSLALCKSCYECFIVGTAFQKNFSVQQMPQPHLQWFCDIGYTGFGFRTLLADLRKSPPDFAHFATAMSKRLELPPCSGEGNAIAPADAGRSYAYRSVQDNSGVWCQSCFHDYIAGTSAEKSFGYMFELEDSQRGTLCCDLATPFSRYAMTTARNAVDFSLWLDPIQAHHALPLCPSIAGTDEAEFPSLGPGWQVWYHFKDHPSIECCPRCYRTNVAVLEAKHLFVPINRALKDGVIRQCYLSPSKDMTSSESWDPMDYENTTFWRGNYLRNVLRYGHYAGNDFTVAIAEAKKIAALPKPCGSELRRFKQASGRKWLGHVATNPNDPNDATIIMCEECHLYSVKGTQLESFLSNNLTHLTYDNPEGHRCSTWSKQCKRRLRTACQTNNFAAYAQYHHKREKVYARIWQSIRDCNALGELTKEHTRRINAETEMTIQMGAIRLAQQMNAQQNAIISGIGGSVAEAAATDYGYRYGNSTVGMGYLTHNGASAAMAYENVANSSYNPPLNIQACRSMPVEQLTAEYKRRLDIQKEIQAEWKDID